MKKVKKIKAVLEVELEIDVSDFNEKYVKVDELALDLIKREIDNNLMHHEFTAENFEYYDIPESDSDRIMTELRIAAEIVGAPECYKAFYDMRLAAKNDDYDTISSMFGGRFIPYADSAHKNVLVTALKKILNRAYGESLNLN